MLAPSAVLASSADSTLNTPTTPSQQAPPPHREEALPSWKLGHNEDPLTSPAILNPGTIAPIKLWLSWKNPQNPHPRFQRRVRSLAEGPPPIRLAMGTYINLNPYACSNITGTHGPGNMTECI